MTRADGWAVAFAVALSLSLAVFGPSPWAIAGPTVALVVVLVDGVARPRSGALLPVVSHGPKSEQAVALTFDDGPDPDTTPQILAALEAARARATFFVIGRQLEAHPELAARIVGGGHELANHSYHHWRWLNFLGPTAMSQDILRGAEAIGRFSQGAPLYRPPIGLKSPPLARVARTLGLTVVTWSLHGRDSGEAPPQRIAERVVARLEAGDIVLLHDGCDRPGRPRTATALALPIILEGLARRGLRAVTVSELVGRTTPTNRAS